MTAPPESTAAPGPGTTIHRYVVLRRLRSTHTSDVYVAQDPHLDRKVALKLLRADVQLEGVEERQLVAEAQAIARLAHPNVVRVHDVGTWDDRPYVAREFVEGTTLAGWQTAGPRTPDQILRVFIQAGRGLAALHAAGFVHRDFTPNAVLVGDDGTVRVADVDFVGLSEATTLRDPPGPGDTHERASLLSPHRRSSVSLDVAMTSSSTSAGHRGYQSPEQIAGQPADARSDQFAFCAALYEALFDRLPHERSGRRMPEHRHGRRIPRRVWTALRRGLSADPLERHEDMSALLGALAPPRRRAAALLLPTVTAGLAAAVTVASMSDGSDHRYCDTAADELERRWNPATATAIIEAFEATELPYATDIANLSNARIDRWSTQWLDRHTELCQAQATKAMPVAELARQMNCLRLHKGELHALVDVLGEADARTVEHASSIVGALPPVEECRQSIPPPADEREAAVNEELERENARLHLLLTSGHLELTIAEADAQITRAEAAGNDRVLIYAKLIRALAHVDLGHPDGISALHAVFSEAVAMRDYETMAEAAMKVASHHTRKREFDLAEQWLGHAESALGDRDVSPQWGSKAGIQSLRGRIASLKGDYPTALAEFRRAMELRLRDLPATDERIAIHRINVAQALQWNGDNEGAQEQFELALRAQQDSLGLKHPNVAQNMMGLSTVLSTRGEHERALDYATKAERSLIATYGENHSLVADAKLSRAMAYAGLNEQAQVYRLQVEALAIYREAVGDRSYRVALTMSNIGGVLYQMGHVEESIEYFEGAVERAREVVGADHTVTMELSGYLAEVLVAAGRLEQGAALIDATTTTIREKMGGDHPMLINPLAAAAELASRRGDDATAVLHLELAIQLVREAGRDPTELAEVRLMLADTLRRAGRRDEANDLEASARRVLASEGSLGERIVEQAETRRARIAAPRTR